MGIIGSLCIGYAVDKTTIDVIEVVATKHASKVITLCLSTTLSFHFSTVAPHQLAADVDADIDTRTQLLSTLRHH